MPLVACNVDERTMLKSKIVAIDQNKIHVLK